MASCIRIFAWILSALISISFVVFGLIKLTPQILPEAHKHVVSEFKRFAEVHPITHFGYKVDANKLRIQIGVIEVICGICVAIGPRLAKIIGCLVLSSAMVGTLYVHYALNEKREKLVIFSLWLLLLFIRLNLFFMPIKNYKAADSKEVAEEKGGTKKTN